MFWDRFYNLCEQNGYKPNPLGKELGISSGVITKWKSDGSLPNGENLLKIAARLSCSVDYLLGRTDVVEVGGGVLLSEDEAVLLDRYRALNDEGREIVRSAALQQRQLLNLERGAGENAASAG